jgi:uncharacterized protein HemX
VGLDCRQFFFQKTYFYVTLLVLSSFFLLKAGNFVQEQQKQEIKKQEIVIQQTNKDLKESQKLEKLFYQNEEINPQNIDELRRTNNDLEQQNKKFQKDHIEILK